jgi:hypothetical protein
LFVCHFCTELEGRCQGYFIDEQADNPCVLIYSFSEGNIKVKKRISYRHKFYPGKPDQNSDNIGTLNTSVSELRRINQKAINDISKQVSDKSCNISRDSVQQLKEAYEEKLNNLTNTSTDSMSKISTKQPSEYVNEQHSEYVSEPTSEHVIDFHGIQHR